MKKYSLLLGAAVVGLSASASFATITLQTTPFTINSTLSSAGWVGYKLTLHADGSSSTGVSGFDLANPGSDPGQLTTNLGIRGNLEQMKFAGSATGADQFPTFQFGGDSYFLTTTSGYNTPAMTGSPPAWASAPLEDNNGLNGTGSWTMSPMTDVPGLQDYGVGSYLTAAAAFATIQQNVDFALIIVPSNQPTTIRGFALDQINPSTGKPTSWSMIDTTLNGASAIPEPASVGLLALGALGLLARRRR